MKENLPVSLQKLIHKVEENFAEEVAKEKLGLVNPDEILLKPNK